MTPKVGVFNILVRSTGETFLYGDGLMQINKINGIE